jgi:hypothetical protein
LSPTSELIDSNGKSTDIGEAFVDFNENGVRDATEPFIDFNTNGVFDGPDGKYSGVLCDETVAGRSSPGSCAPTKTLHVRGSGVVVLSGSRPVFTLTASSTTPAGGIQLPTCVNGTPFVNSPVSFRLDITDEWGNAMPAGTTIALATSNGTLSSLPLSFVVPNTTACANPGTGNCPSSAPQLLRSGFGSFFGTIISDATQSLATAAPPLQCSNTRNSGQLTVTVTTPRGSVTTVAYGVSD